ncbi:MAG: hypothetical protein K1X83_01435 [Oligoflexia bacterium]|nr:hypothetical protein [Oligoflexia bacterium]
MTAPAIKSASIEDSLTRRYLSRLFASFISIPLITVTQALLARGAGPAIFGDFAFLSKLCQDTLTLLDSGATSAFFSQYSHSPGRSELVRFYAKFSVATALLLAGLVYLADLTPLAAYLWPALPFALVALACLYAILLWGTQLLQSVIDARALTVRGERTRVFHRGAVMLLVAGCFWFLGSFTALQFFILQCVSIAIFLGMLWILGLGPQGRAAFTQQPAECLTVQQIAHSFWNFCHPLIPYNLVSLGIGLADRWVLQFSSGSRQQGYFALSSQVGALTFLFTSSMAGLLTRELSSAVGKSDRTRMASLYSETVTSLYVLTAGIGVFAAVECTALTQLLGGQAFAGAQIAVALMMIYPLHQTFGQLNASVFFAEARTKVYRNIGLTVPLLGLPLGVWLLFPARLGGLDLGATGLAIKLVLTQFIQVNAQLWVISRWLKLSHWQLLRHQFAAPLLFFGAAFIAHQATAYLAHSNLLLALLFSGIIYLALISCLILKIPQTLGLSKERIAQLKSYLLLMVYAGSRRNE